MAKGFDVDIPHLVHYLTNIFASGFEFAFGGLHFDPLDIIRRRQPGGSFESPGEIDPVHCTLYCQLIHCEPVADMLLAIIRGFWQKNFSRRPVIKPSCVIPDMRIALKSLKRSSALTIAAEYLLDDDLRVIWSGRVPLEHTLYLAYDKTRVGAEMVGVMKGFTSEKAL